MMSATKWIGAAAPNQLLKQAIYECVCVKLEWSDVHIQAIATPTK